MKFNEWNCAWNWKKIWKRSAIKAQLILKTLDSHVTSTMFQDKKLKCNATSAIAEVAEVALCPPLHPTITIKPSKGTLSGDYEGAEKVEKERVGDREKENWLVFIGVARIFIGGANHKSHAMTSSEIFKKELFAGQRYRRMEDPKL